MSTDKKLQTYHNKRNFNKTPEPSGKEKFSGKSSRFVIHKHDARNLHYDLRLEFDGVLKSWAIPKGPSTDPGTKRLAISTEDHPLSYFDFEGIIPEGNYGAGTVLVWDFGKYKNINEKDGKSLSMDEAMKKGHLKFWLKGKKLKGGFALIQTGKSQDNRWLLVKMDDDEADARRNPTSTEPNSVLGGKSLEKIRDDNS